jgi:hypothetical protein
MSAIPLDVGPIINANARTIPDSFSTTPSMRSTLSGWFRPITMVLIKKVSKDHQIVEIRREIKTVGVIQPLTGQALEIKPEGERSWAWKELHCLPDLILETDDVVEIGGKPNRVMARKDYRDFGYLRYELVEDYQTRA